MFMKTHPAKAMLTLEIPAQTMSGHDISVKMPENHRFTDQEFFDFCQMNQHLKFERDAQGNILIMANTTPRTGIRNSELNLEVGLWNRQHKSGIVFDSSSAFTLPTSAVRWADLAWMTTERWNAISDAGKDSFTHICPDFVIELMSKSDRLAGCREKMDEWMANGCRLAWLIDPDGEKAYIYRQGRETEIVSFAGSKLSGEDVLQGFELDLKILE